MLVKRLLVPLACAAVLAAGCGSDPKPTPVSETSKHVPVTKVKMSDYKYAPAKVEIKQDTVISFTNDKNDAHTATSTEKGLFDSGDVTKSVPEKVTFEKPGTFTYYCKYHPRMKGTVKVDP
jgi:plastocyanin